MMNTKPTGPIEVWLTQANLEVTCRVVHEDESTTTPDVDSLSMRGAQREMTGYFIAQGYKPEGRWSTELMTATDGALETARRFKPGDAR